MCHARLEGGSPWVPRILEEPHANVAFGATNTYSSIVGPWFREAVSPGYLAAVLNVV